MPLPSTFPILQDFPEIRGHTRFASSPARPSGSAYRSSYRKRSGNRGGRQKCATASGSCSARIVSRRDSVSRSASPRCFRAFWSRLACTLRGEHTFSAHVNPFALPIRVRHSRFVLGSLSFAVSNARQLLLPFNWRCHCFTNSSPLKMRVWY
jgi:hypothetical protein